VFEVVVLILVAVICPLVWACSVFFVLVLFRFWFRHQTLIITPDEYQYIERFVHFTSVLYAFLRPSGRSNIEEQRPERNGKERRGSRQRFLKARVRTWLEVLVYCLVLDGYLGGLSWSAIWVYSIGFQFSWVWIDNGRVGMVD